MAPAVRAPSAPLTRPLTTSLSQERRHLGVRLRSRGVWRPAKGTLGFPGAPYRPPPGGMQWVALVFPMRLILTTLQIHRPACVLQDIARTVWSLQDSSSRAASRECKLADRDGDHRRATHDGTRGVAAGRVTRI